MSKFCKEFKEYALSHTQTEIPGIQEKSTINHWNCQVHPIYRDHPLASITLWTHRYKPQCK